MNSLKKLNQSTFKQTMIFYSAEYMIWKKKSPFCSGQSNGSTYLMSGMDKMSARQQFLQNCCSPRTRPHGATTEEISICVVIRTK